jgi:hypothetical protein
VSTTEAALDFPACRERLEGAITASCDEHCDWATSVVAGIRAALEFAAEDPVAARRLTERGKARWAERDPEFAGMVDRLAALLRHGAPTPHPRLPSAELLITCMAEQVNLRIRAGRAEQMMEIAPDLVFLALMPFLGFFGARQWAQLAATP